MKTVPMTQYLNQYGKDPSVERPPPVFRSLSEVAASPRNAIDRRGFEAVKWPLARNDSAPAAIAEIPSPRAVESQVEEAYQRGLRDGKASARDELAGLRATERAAERERIEGERIDFHLGEYAQLANVIGAGLVEIEERISACVARIVAPFLDGQIADQMLDELGESLRSLRSGLAPALITVRGPERLLSRLRERAAALGGGVEYAPDDGIEIRVEAGDTRIETQLKLWAGLLASVEGRG